MRISNSSSRYRRCAAYLRDPPLVSFKCGIDMGGLTPTVPSAMFPFMVPVFQADEILPFFPPFCQLARTSDALSAGGFPRFPTLLILAYL